MRMTMIYTFPLLPLIRKPLCTPLHQGPEGVLGFVIKGLSDSPTVHGNFSFFLIDGNRGTVSHHSGSLPPGHINRMHLYYDQSRSLWALGVEGSRGSLEVYELYSEINQQWTKLFWVDTKDMGLGNKVLVAMWQQDEQYPLVFYVVDIGETSDSRMYWMQWRSTEHENYQAPQPIGYCDTVVPFIADKGCLLFLCQRAFYKEPEEPDLRRGPGNWQIGIAAYRSDGVLIRQEPLSDVTFPIRNPELPSKDLLDWLRIRMSVTDGPRYGPDGQRTCVAALVLQDTSGIATEKGSKGGLYCVDMQGEVIHREASPLGEQISLCLCGETVIGTDVFDGHRRLWRWSPLAGTELQIEAYLSPDVQRATVVAIKEDEIIASQFWCVEEHLKGVRISRWRSEPLVELQDVWYEGMTLPDDLVASYIRDRKPIGIVAYQNVLFILGIDKDKQLKCFRVQ